MKKRLMYTLKELKQTFLNVPLSQNIFILLFLVSISSWKFGFSKGIFITITFYIFEFLYMGIIIFISKED